MSETSIMDSRLPSSCFVRLPEANATTSNASRGSSSGCQPCTTAAATAKTSRGTKRAESSPSMYSISAGV
eukprot:37479-Eustigmatos_ZCMA.PRE.1